MLTLPFSCQNKVRAASFVGPDPDAARQTSNDDPRLTRVGRVVQRSAKINRPRGELDSVEELKSGRARHQIEKLRKSEKWSM